MYICRYAFFYSGSMNRYSRHKKNKQVNVKLANFMTKNPYVPIAVKLKVVKAGINSAFTFVCEGKGMK